MRGHTYGFAAENDALYFDRIMRQERLWPDAEKVGIPRADRGCGGAECYEYRKVSGEIGRPHAGVRNGRSM